MTGSIEHKDITGLDALHQIALQSDTDPGATLGAGKVWLDTSTGRVMLRKDDNTAWLDVSAPAESYADVNALPPWIVGAPTIARYPKSRANYNIMDFDATLTGTSDSGEDITNAIIAAHAEAVNHSHKRGIVELPPGFWRMADELLIDKQPIHVIGAGAEQTIILNDPAYTGTDKYLFGIDNLWRNAGGDDAAVRDGVAGGNSRDFSLSKYGAMLRGFSLISSRSAQVNGIRTIRTVDGLLLEDIWFSYLGTYLSLGDWGRAGDGAALSQGVSGLVRESWFSRLRAYWCGDFASGLAGELITTGLTGDATNNLDFLHCYNVYPRGIASHVKGTTAHNKFIRRIDRWGGLLHGTGQFGESATAADVAVIEGGVTGHNWHRTKMNGSSYVAGTRYAQVRFKSMTDDASTEVYPQQFDAEVDLRSWSGHGLIVERAGNFSVSGFAAASSTGDQPDESGSGGDALRLEANSLSGIVDLGRLKFISGAAPVIDSTIARNNVRGWPSAGHSITEFAPRHRGVSANFVVDPTDDCVHAASCAGGMVTATIPDATANLRLLLWFVKTDTSANVFRLTPVTATDVIGSGAAGASYDLTNQHDYVILQSNGSGAWKKVASGTSDLSGRTVGSSTAATSEVLNFNAVAGQVRGTQYMTGGVLRAFIGVNGAAESGANAGSNILWSAYDDTGVLLYSIQFNRASGLVTFPKNVTANQFASKCQTFSTATAPASIDIGSGSDVEITFTANTAGAIPTPASIAGAGSTIRFTLINSSGGALTAKTWNAAYKLPATFAWPASGKSRTVVFRRDASNTQYNFVSDSGDFG